MSQRMADISKPVRRTPTQKVFYLSEFLVPGDAQQHQVFLPARYVISLHKLCFFREVCGTVEQRRSCGAVTFNANKLSEIESH